MKVRPPPSQFKLRLPPAPKKVVKNAEARAHHRSIMRRVSIAAPLFDQFNRWAVEVAFIDAAYLYETGDTAGGMPDHAWDELGRYLARTWNKRSPYFKGCIDRKVLTAKPTNLAVNWDVGLARAAQEFWT